MSINFGDLSFKAFENFGQPTTSERQTLQSSPLVPSDAIVRDDTEMNTFLDDARITVKRGVFLKAPKVNPTVARPHTLDTSSNTAVDAVNTLGNLIHEYGTIPESKLRQLGSQIVTCSTDHEGYVAIPRGWETERLRFLLIFEVVTNRGIRYYETLTGYTDMDEQRQDGAVSDEMRLIFNNVIRVKPTMVQDQFGGQTERLSLMSTHQVMSTLDGNANFDITGFSKPVPKEMITPTTLLQRMEYQSSSWGGGGQVLDSRSRVGTEGGLSMANRQNTLGSNFFANTFLGTKNAITSLEYNANGSYHMSPAGIYRTAANHTLASESSVMEDLVLSRIRANSDYGYRGSITWQRFSQLFPESSMTCEVLRSMNVHETQEPQIYAGDLMGATAGNVEDWSSTHLATVKAQQLLVSIPALMMDTLISSITFQATNMTTGFSLEPFQMDFSFASSFLGDNVNMNPFIDLFRSEFRNRIHDVISDNGLLHYLITVHCNALGEFRMSVKYDGLPMTYHYNAGTFCDHLYTPTLTQTPTRLNTLAQDFSGILSNALHY